MTVNLHRSHHSSVHHSNSHNCKHHAKKSSHQKHDECDIEDRKSSCHSHSKSKKSGEKPQQPSFSHSKSPFHNAVSKLRQVFGKTSGSNSGKPSDLPPSPHIGTVTSTSGADKAPHGINLSKFGALQLPTGKPGSPDTIYGGKLSSYNSPAFRQGNGKITFNVPKGGVTTKNSQHARSELKENHTWNLSAGTSKIGGTVSIDHPPGGNGTVTFAQIHQERKDGKAPRPPVELQYKNGKIVASIMTGLNSSGHSNREEVEIASGIKPGQKFDYSMKLSPNGQLEISAAGHTKSVHLNSSVTDQPMYFKAGNYPQQDDDSSLSYYNLDISHQK